MKKIKEALSSQPNDLIPINTQIRSDRDKYIVMKFINKGRSSKVYKVEDLYSNAQYAIKIYSYGHIFTKLALNEVNILERVQSHPKFVRMYDNFIYKSQFCIVEELLSNNLYEIIKSVKFHGFIHQYVKVIGKQILDALEYLEVEGITHCDLKPENICVENNKDGKIKVKIIDFNDSFLQPRRNQFYVQSRYYRAPETFLGLNYGKSVDLWSFSCIMYELFTGNPLFPGKDNKEQIIRHVYLLGMPSQKLLELGDNVSQFFEKTLEFDPGFVFNENENRKRQKKDIIGIVEPYVLYSCSEIDRNTLIDYKKFQDQINRKHNSLEENTLFSDFIFSGLHIDSFKRKTASELLSHPYLLNINENVENFLQQANTRRKLTKKIYPSHIYRRKSLHDFQADKIREKTRRNSTFPLDDTNRDYN